MDYRLLGRAMSYKTLMLMYFASGVFLLMLWDLVWAREGAASMTTLWQVFLLAVLLSGAHFCCYEEGILPRVPARVKRVLHLVVTYLVVLAELFLFGWAPRPDLRDRAGCDRDFSRRLRRALARLLRLLPCAEGAA